MKERVLRFIKRGGLVKVGTLLIFIGVVMLVAYFLLV